jgi:hypothetical protein
METIDLIPSLKDIDLVDLQVDVENYRLGPQLGQNEAIHAMIDEQGAKLVELAEDILDVGLSPIELIIVCPADQAGKFRVLEGNRRVTALKLLNEPALAAHTSIAKPIHKLGVKHAAKIPKTLACKVVPTKQEAFIWIQRKHDTGFGGAAMIPWSAIQIRRAKAAQGNRQVTLEVIDLVGKNPNLPAPVKQKLAKLAVTNLERILEDPSSLALLGAEVRGGELVCKNDQTWTLNVLTDIVSDIATKKIKVGDIYDDAKRKKYIQKVKTQQPHPPSQVTEWAVTQGGKISTPAATGQKGSTTRTLPIHRKYLIPTSCRLQIPHPRLNAIYHELRRGLRVDDVPNAVSVMLRVFVELGVDHYIAKKKITVPNSKLYGKLQAVADWMQQNNIMTKVELKPVRLAISRPNDILSTETLNAYVHSGAVLPKPRDLRDAWDSIEPFVTNLWK